MTDPSLAFMGQPDKPLAIDLFTGLHGWSEGLIAAGWRVIGFDIEDMSRKFGEPPPDGDFQLVVQDVLTLHGSQFRDAQLIVGSSPCQEFSYRAMPWKRAKALGPPELGMELFHAQFRIQREACEAAGRYIPLVVENVRGAQPWVGRARWNFGSYYLWGDLPALMPNVPRAMKNEQGGSWFGLNPDGSPGALNNARDRHTKGGSGSWFNDYKSRAEKPSALLTMTSSKSPARKAASAKIAKIPFTLAEWIGRAWYPAERA